MRFHGVKLGIADCTNLDSESVNFRGVKLEQADRVYFTERTWQVVGRTTYQGANRMIWRSAHRTIAKGPFRRALRLSVMRSLCL
jgi:hypothetical protein